MSSIFLCHSLPLTGPAAQHQRRGAACGGSASKGKLNRSARLPELAVQTCVVAHQPGTSPKDLPCFSPNAETETTGKWEEGLLRRQTQAAIRRHNI